MKKDFTDFSIKYFTVVSASFQGMEKTKLLHSEITEKVIGCAMKVHTYFGLGFPEIIYKRALLIELNKVGI